VISVIVPAHDEGRVIARLLSALVRPGVDAADGDEATELEIIVVANGCTDDTAEVAATFPGVTVLRTPTASKALALRAGDEVAIGFPRVYVDADVEISRAAVVALARALARPGVHAAAPHRVLPRDDVTPPVRWFYDVWEELPNVQAGLFGRGVVAVSRKGFERIHRLPEFMADDLALSAAFDDDERRVVREAVAVVRPPRTWADLVRRRARVATGTRQVYAYRGGLRTDSRTTAGDLLAVVAHRPGLAVKLPVLLAVAILARRRAARAVAAGDFRTWLRDESSRQV
jgi:glycosyltransferase involved in cell wall biosynthesis